VVATNLLSAEDLERMEAGSDARFELVRGELFEVAAVGWGHGRIAFRFGHRVATFAFARGLGELVTSDTGFILERDPDVVLKPDVAFVRHDHVPPDDASPGFVPLVPDLVIEVVSTNDTRREVARKVALYQDAGVPMTVVVEPDARTLTVHRPGQPPERLEATETFDGGDVLPGFRLAVADVFR